MGRDGISYRDARVTIENTKPEYVIDDWTTDADPDAAILKGATSGCAWSGRPSLHS